MTYLKQFRDPKEKRQAQEAAKLLWEKKKKVMISASRRIEEDGYSSETSWYAGSMHSGSIYKAKRESPMKFHDKDIISRG